MNTLTDSQAERIERLIADMSPEEKVAQLTGSGMRQLLDDRDRLSRDKMLERLANGIGQITLSAGASTLAPEQVAENVNTVQRFLAEETRCGIPAIVDDECVAGFVGMGATHFPQAIGMAAAWSPELTQRMADTIRQQAMAVGSRLMYSPVFDVCCDPRWGRIEETWGEDPYLVSQTGVAFVRGLQGESLSHGVAATLKHFAGYGAPEGGRNCAPAHIGPRELREVYLLPFEAAVKAAGAQSVMAAYNEIDGVPCAASKELLTDILRGEWGFEGIVVADWGVIEMLKNFHHIADSASMAGAQALTAGLDVETPSAVCFGHAFVEAVRRGDVPGWAVDRALRRHLRLKILLGLFDNPYVRSADAARTFDTAAQRAVALEAARQSMTLLKNDGSLLPLRKDIGCIAVIGPNADSTHSLLGDYSYSVYRRLEGDAVKIVSVLEGIKNTVSPQTRVLHAPGCDVMTTSADGLADAMRAAAQADVVIAVVGDRSALHDKGTSGENLDRAELDLSGGQEKMLRELRRTGKPLVVVLVNGRPPTVEWAAANAQAILEAWLPGEEGGRAVADALFGDMNPGGKLPVSLLRAVGQTPASYRRRSSSFADHAKYVFTERGPLYPFGHGLSYTQFKYSDLAITPPVVHGEDEVRVSCAVANVGGCRGDEVVQFYVRDPLASMTRPRMELKGFCRLHLKPGESRSLTFTMPVEMLAFHDSAMRLVVEPGTFEVMIGSSSEDIRLRGVFNLAEERGLNGRRRFVTEVSGD